jgi:TonB family protein
VRELFVLGEFPEALRQLEDCTVKLGEKWGYTAEEQHRISKPAKPVQGLDSLFSGDDYPLAALHDQTMGRVRVKIPLNSSGEPTDCQIVSGSGSVDLDAATCRIILTRAKFEPAIDVDGKPVRSVYVETIQWVLI